MIINPSTTATVGTAMQQHLTNQTTTIRSKLIYGTNISVQSHETSSSSYYSKTCLIKIQSVFGQHNPSEFQWNTSQNSSKQAEK
jgi:hypothetical protein